MAVMIERFDSREITVSRDSPSGDLMYMVTGTEDELAVKTIVEATIPAFFYDLSYESYHMAHQGGGVWEVSVRYTLKKPNEKGDVTWSFDLSADTTHITHSKQTIQRYAKSGETAPDFKGAIGYDGESIQGCDILVPTYKWTETYYPPIASLTVAYANLVYNLVGKTNNAIFRGKALGEVLLVGAQGGKKDEEKGEISFHFMASPNVTGLSIGDITGINKKGWEYLWVLFAEQEKDTSSNPPRLVKRPKAVYVERVYDSGDFSALGIGT
jgi:hypothetical protein